MLGNSCNNLEVICFKRVNGFYFQRYSALLIKINKRLKQVMKKLIIIE